MISGQLTTTQQLTIEYPLVTDEAGNSIPVTSLEWHTSNDTVSVSAPVNPAIGLVVAKAVGQCEVWITGLIDPLNDGNQVTIEGEHVFITVVSIVIQHTYKFGTPILSTPTEQTPDVLVGFFVATDGLDTNDGLSINSPMKTINECLARMNPGDIAYVRGGIYPENITWVPSGTPGNPITLKNYPGEIPWLKPTIANPGGHVIWLDGNWSYFDFDGINVDGSASNQVCIWTSTNNGNDPHHIRIMNAEAIAGAQGGAGAIHFGAHGADVPIGATGSNTARNMKIHGGGLPGNCGFACASYAVYISGPGNIIENCDMYDVSGAFIQLYSRGDPANRNIIRNNRMHDLSRAGHDSEIWGILSLGDDNEIYNNLIYNITFVGTSGGNAAIAMSGKRNKVYFNTLYNNKNNGLLIDAQGVDNIVRDNIAYLHGGQDFIDSGSGTIQDHNLSGVDPKFVNTGAGPYDFHLQNGSPAKHTGVAISEVTKDLDGITRSSIPSMGCYE